ncbi:hypothetical protein L0244_09395, partial [bacterium]|nr:hypothetical protein [bacterium]
MPRKVRPSRHRASGIRHQVIIVSLITKVRPLTFLNKSAKEEQSRVRTVNVKLKIRRTSNMKRKLLWLIIPVGIVAVL